ncbi:efflux RND transporter periplasmic adaptor subunit [soil metagenome]
MKRALALVATLGLLGLASCNQKKEAPAPGPITVTVTPVVTKDVMDMRTWVGLLTGNKNADIRAQVTGYLMTQNYKEGSTVKEGTTLFTIDKRPFEASLAQAQANYAKSVAQAQLSQITLDRQTQLYKTKVISQQEYDTSYQNAQADVAAVASQQAAVQTAQINLNYCTITAPFDGITGVAQAQIGDLVGPGGTSSVLTQMSQVNPIKVNFSITEEEYLTAASLIKTLSATAPDKLKSALQLRLADGSEYPQRGRFDFLNRQINTATGTIQITGLFPNDDDLLRPGLFARITAPVKMLNNALVVPQQAVVEMQGKHLVSIVGPDNVIAVRPVELGPLDGPLQVIEKGLQAGDKVVVEGVEKVRPGMKVNVQAYQAPTPSPTPSAPGETPKQPAAQ